MRRPEQTLQGAVSRFLTVACQPPTWWSAIGHGGGGALRGKILKSMGVKAGVPDILLVHPVAREGGGYGCWLIGIELKSAKGRQSPQQKATQAAFEKAGGYYHIAKSVDDVERILRACAIPLHASVMGRAA